jgi:D-3-phosphoglycerate dehydrogenase
MPHIGASTEEAEDNCAIMAADQLKDFLENGNIKNSVNFPVVKLDPVDGFRLAITNDNVPKILGSVLNILAEENINVIDMLNKSRNDIAYNLIDICSEPSESVVAKICALEGILNVRLIA